MIKIAVVHINEEENIYLNLEPDSSSMSVCHNSQLKQRSAFKQHKLDFLKGTSS